MRLTASLLINECLILKRATTLIIDMLLIDKEVVTSAVAMQAFFRVTPGKFSFGQHGFSLRLLP